MALLEYVRETTAGAAVQAAARHLVGAITASDLYSPVGARVAIPGGSALAAFGPALRELPERVRRRMHLTWADERCVDEGDPASNHGTARRQGLVPADCASVLPLWLAGETQEVAQPRIVDHFVRTLDTRLDVALLGLGEDGHIASLFPGHPMTDTTNAFSVYVPDAPKPPPARISLALGLFKETRLSVLLATGEAKRAALTRLLRREEWTPAGCIDRLIVVTDLEIEQ